MVGGGDTACVWRRRWRRGRHMGSTKGQGAKLPSDGATQAGNRLLLIRCGDTRQQPRTAHLLPAIQKLWVLVWRLEQGRCGSHGEVHRATRAQEEQRHGDVEGQGEGRGLGGAGQDIACMHMGVQRVCECWVGWVEGRKCVCEGGGEGCKERSVTGGPGRGRTNAPAPKNMRTEHTDTERAMVTRRDQQPAQSSNGQHALDMRSKLGEDGRGGHGETC